MLTAARNELLTRVGPGTPMGDLLRRYWQPIGGASELDNQSDQADPAAGRGPRALQGPRAARYGLVDRHCPHRRADMSYGWVEDDGIRCSYHGWLLRRERGRASSSRTRTPPTRSRSKAGCGIKAYPVREMAGLLWAYMGPQPAPELPVWEPFTWHNGFREIVLADVPCNWFQCQENSIDPGAFRMDARQLVEPDARRATPMAPKHLKLKFEEFEHGFIYKRVREGQSEEDRYWTVGRVALWPNGFYLGRHFEWRVPVDDENTLSVAGSSCACRRAASLTCRTACRPGRARSAATDGRWITSHVINQDIVAWVGQGAIADRTQREPALERHRHHDDAPALLRGDRGDQGRPRPEGRDPQSEPGAGHRPARHGARAEHRGHSARRVSERSAAASSGSRNSATTIGQPAEVRAEFCEAMGIAAS